MQYLDPEVEAAFERRLDRARVPQAHHADYHKWVSLYLQFCQELGFPPTAPTALGPFLTKLAHKGHSIDQRHHAGVAIRLLIRRDPQDPSLYLKLSAPSSAAPEPSPAAGLPPRSRPLPASWDREYRDLESAVKLRNYSANGS